MATRRVKWATAVYYKYLSTTGKTIDGVLLIRGQLPANAEKYFDKVSSEIMKKGIGTKGHPIKEILECQGVTRGM